MKKTLEYQKNPEHLSDVDDMSALIYLEEPNVLENLDNRYNKNLIYTSVSNILVAVNPYQLFPELYTLDLMTIYKITEHKRSAAINSILKPHIYLLGRRAFHDMIKTNRNQSLVICGESGSGKTESAKHMMRYLAASMIDNKCVENEKGSISERVLAVNPVLESFGNAQTILNNNSSRFGKFTKLVFNKNNKIIGSFIETYLLEKSRVVYQDIGEKNFHIFYLICSLPKDSDEYKELKLRDSTEYKFLYDCYTTKKSIPSETHITEYERLMEVQQALLALEISKEQIMEIFKIVSAILHMGNIEFKEGSKGDFAVFNDDENNSQDIISLNNTAILLGIDTELLSKRLLTRSITVNKERVEKKMSVTDAIKNRNAFCKSLYNGIFDYITKKINNKLYSKESREDNCKWIGILDVFGFENFKHNSFEQFCINFANERLQQYFNQCIIKSEQDEYLIEGIQWEEIEVPDNQGCINLIEKPINGILAVLESACKGPRPTDKVFTDTLFGFHRYHRYMKRVNRIKVNNQFSDFNGFLIKHYAAEVTYDAIGWIQKSTDSTHEDSTILMNKSSYTCHKLILSKEDDDKLSDNNNDKTDNKESDTTEEEVKKKGHSRVRGSISSKFSQFEQQSTKKYVSKYSRANLSGNTNKKKKTANIGMIFSTQLSSLMDMLSGTNPYFIRCIKPNAEKEPNNFHWEYVSPQLRCQGLVEALRILKCGYPTRTTYESIYDRYGKILNPPPSNLNKRDFCEAVLRVCGDGLPRDQFELGLTKVFFRPGQAEFLEDLLNSKDDLSSQTINLIKLFLLHKRFQRVKSTIFVHILFARKLRQNRAIKKWSQLLTTAKAVNKLVYRPLKRIRTRNAISIIQSFIRANNIKKAYLEKKSNMIHINDYLNHQIRLNSIQSKLKQLEMKRIEEIRKAKEDEIKRKELEEREKRRQEQLALLKKKREEAEAKAKAEAEEKKRIEEERLAEQKRILQEKEEQLKKDIKNDIMKQVNIEQEKIKNEKDQLLQSIDAEKEKTNFALNKLNTLKKKYNIICEFMGINAQDDDVIVHLKVWQNTLKDETDKRIALEKKIVELEKKIEDIKQSNKIIYDSNTPNNSSNIVDNVADEPNNDNTYDDTQNNTKNSAIVTKDNDDKNVTITALVDDDDDDIDGNEEIIENLHEEIRILKGTIEQLKLNNPNNNDESKLDNTFNYEDIDIDKIKTSANERALNRELARQRKRAINAQLESSRMMKWAVKFSSDYKRRPSIAKIHEELKLVDREVKVEEINVSNCLNELELYEEKLKEAGNKQKTLKEAYAWKNGNLNDDDINALKQIKLNIKEVALKKIEAAKKLQISMDIHAKKVKLRDQLRDERELKLVTSASKKVPDIEKGREFFMMTAISILKGIEEDGIIGSAKRESSWVFRLFEIALLEDIPFYHWSDWLNERIRETIRQRELRINEEKRRKQLKQNLKRQNRSPIKKKNTFNTRGRRDNIKDDGCIIS